VENRVLNPELSPRVRAGCCALAVMTKAPRAGKVKTRLIPPLTPEEAADLNICFLHDITAGIGQATQATNAIGIAVFTPLGAENSYRGILPDDFFLVPQRGEAFGERLLFATEDLFRLGFESVCLINSDSPTVPPNVFIEAAQALEKPGDRVVLGPSDDGGYYLIGLKKLHRRLFADIEWSTEKVLQQTFDRAAELQLDVHELPTWFDVDDCATLQRLCGALLQSAATSAPATRHFLDDLVAREGRKRIWPNE
jgi:rSAM/selenodomain-associated transferase 1